MVPALQVSHLTKRFKDFTLDDISFTVPAGSVVGIIGENGSGKSTTIRCILGQDIPDSGTIEIYGVNALEHVSTHARLGAAFDSSCFPPMFSARKIESVLRDIYSQWDSDLFTRLLEENKIAPDKKVSAFSRGMKAKLAMICALCHNPGLLILDEATAGLDPVVRESLLDLLLDFMQDETHSILMTSHITSDLEKIADYILFIKDGKIVFMEEKDRLLDSYAIARITRDQLEFIDPALIARRRTLPSHLEIFTSDRQGFTSRYPDYVLVPATLDDLVLFFEKGELA